MRKMKVSMFLASKKINDSNYHFLCSNDVINNYQIQN